MNLPDLNDRWRATDKPHAVPTPDNPELFHWHCPPCGESGQTGVPLIAAMSEALVHKKSCAEVG